LLDSLLQEILCWIIFNACSEFSTTTLPYPQVVREVPEFGRDIYPETFVMADEFLLFYHYTSLKAAKRVLIAGKILPSTAANGDAAFGDGVYLTMLEPQYGEEKIMKNNWDGAAVSRDKVEAFFEIQMPGTKAVRAEDKRDILVHKGDLVLSDYKWNLKSWDGVLLATQHFRVSSSGRAREEQGGSMGRYTLYPQAVLSHAGLELVPVYKHDDRDLFLYLNRGGNWSVGAVIGDDRCKLVQIRHEESPSPAPSKYLSWQYAGTGWKGDDTLKVYPCYIKE